MSLFLSIKDDDIMAFNIMSRVFDVFVHCRILCLVGAWPSMLLESGFLRLLCFPYVSFPSTIFIASESEDQVGSLFFRCFVFNLHQFATTGINRFKESSDTVGF